MGAYLCFLSAARRQLIHSDVCSYLPFLTSMCVGVLDFSNPPSSLQGLVAICPEEPDDCFTLNHSLLQMYYITDT